MRSPHPLRNGDTPSPLPRISHFQSTLSVQKLRRFNSLILVFRLATFCFTLAASVFMLTNSRGSDLPRWFDFDAFRVFFAANAIVAIYSLFEMGVSVWEISKGTTFFPEIFQVWFDFGHDQVQLNTFNSIRIPVTVGGLGGDGAGQDIERQGHVYGVKCVLCAVRYFSGLGICWVSVSGVFVFAVGVSGSLFYNQRLSFPSLVSEGREGMFVMCEGVGYLLCTLGDLD
ncbi:hypothetical protein Pint_06262 [Pistacia integerrima]|uniref:Uncharacterized protein n=1 Tax=Pistacia integerrima TaxID=434235 RepID=A0ACC0Z865_9ROSI|nr:hypothetical protein Pint_06262 [Pistacia integerrima]